MALFLGPGGRLITGMSDSLGQMLRAAREAKGLSLEEVEKTTRIRARYLAALEAEAFGELPSPVQLRGFLRNYAQHVGLNAEQLLALYEQARGKQVHSGALPPSAAAAPAPPPTPAPRRPPVYQTRPQPVRTRRPRWLSADVLVAVIVTGGLAVLLVWGGVQIVGRLRAAAGSAAPAQATDTPQATLTPAGPSDLPTSAPLPSPLPIYIGVNLTVQAAQRIWLSVRVDGLEQFAGLLRPGEAKNFVGQATIELVTSSGRGTRVIWNGRDQGTLGETGEVVTRIWTLEGPVLPTATVTPTPTVTATPTATEPPSATPRPSATAKP